MGELRDNVVSAVQFLEVHEECPKHHVVHTGKQAYLLDFYDFLGEHQKAKDLIWRLLDRIVDNGEGGKVFYPGHMNPVNMSQNVIDTGAAVDAIARFAHNNPSIFNGKEHRTIKETLGEVVETYLQYAAHEKQITNQRLWGLTGLASYARYAGKESEYRERAVESIERAFADMTPDGFFRYYPEAPDPSRTYDSVSAYYQSRHTAFIMYALDAFGILQEEYGDFLEKSIRALLAFYNTEGVKDIRMECKRWYWHSTYEVVSHSFDAYALFYSHIPEAHEALLHVVYQLKNHWRDGELCSHSGHNDNFQCSIFWTAHLAWFLRIPESKELFEVEKEPVPFSYTFEGQEIFSITNATGRFLLQTFWTPRSITTGIQTCGISFPKKWYARIPHIPYGLSFSIREVLNHALHALRGGRYREAVRRVRSLIQGVLTLIVPQYSYEWGRVTSLKYTHAGNAIIEIVSATRYGTLHPRASKRFFIQKETRTCVPEDELQSFLRGDIIQYMPDDIEGTLVYAECAYGAHLNALLSKVKKCIAIDTSLEHINFCREREDIKNNLRCTVVCESLSSLKTKDSVGGVFLESGTLDDAAMAFRILKSEGVLCIGFPRRGIFFKQTYTRALRKIGYRGSLEWYAVYPSVKMPWFIIPYGDTTATQFLVKMMAPDTPLGSIVSWFAQSRMCTSLARFFFGGYYCILRK